MLQKKDRGLAIFWMILFLCQPLALSFAMGAITDWNSTSEIEYNVTDHVTGSSLVWDTYKENGTQKYYTDQTLTHANATTDTIIASLDFATVTSATKAALRYYVNTTFLDGLTITKVEIAYNYVGEGNLTSVSFGKSTPTPAKTFSGWGDTETVPVTIANNGTLIFTPEAFEATQLSVMTKCYGYFVFNDANDLPIDADYIEISVKFYESSLLISAETILQGVAGALILLNLIAILAITNVWNPKE